MYTEYHRPWNLRDSLHGATEDPSTTNILEGRTTFRWVYMQNVRSMLLTVERESLYYFCSVCPLHGANIFLILGSSNLSARKILVQLEDHSVRDNLNPLHVNWIQKTYSARTIRLQGSSSLQVNSLFTTELVRVFLKLGNVKTL